MKKLLVAWIRTFWLTWWLLLLAGAQLLALQKKAGELLQLLLTFTFKLRVYPENFGARIELAALPALEQVVRIHVKEASDDEEIVAPWLRLQPTKPRIETVVRDPRGPAEGLSVRALRVDLTLKPLGEIAHFHAA